MALSSQSEDLENDAQRWSVHGLQKREFRGFVRFRDLPSVEVPGGAGVYAVMRSSSALPEFLLANPAGHFKGKDPTVDQSLLEAAWVVGSEVIYIGKAGLGAVGRRGLRKRLEEYRRHGAGEAVAHWGGRYVWQLADSADLLVAWLETPDGDPEDVEATLIDDFVSTFGQRPFANRKAGRRPESS
jgi:hypothetical protein